MMNIEPWFTVTLRETVDFKGHWHQGGSTIYLGICQFAWRKPKKLGRVGRCCQRKCRAWLQLGHAIGYLNSNITDICSLHVWVWTFQLSSLTLFSIFLRFFFSHFEVLDLDILDEPRFKIRPIKFEVHIQYIWTSIE